MIQTNDLFRMGPLVPVPSSVGSYSVPKASGCHYRGWVMVERTNGLYMAKDNLHYTRIASGYGEHNETVKRFRALVDEREAQ